MRMGRRSQGSNVLTVLGYPPKTSSGARSTILSYLQQLSWEMKTKGNWPVTQCESWRWKKSSQPYRMLVTTYPSRSAAPWYKETVKQEFRSRVDATDQIEPLQWSPKRFCQRIAQNIKIFGSTKLTPLHSSAKKKLCEQWDSILGRYEAHWVTIVRWKGQ